MIFEKHLDFIILDINRPKMSGIEFYERTSSEKGKPFLPAIVLTAGEERILQKARLR